MLPTITGEFTLGRDPELRFAPSGTAVCSVSAVANSRKKNDAGEWENDKTIWVKLTCFNQLAEHVAESLVKGDKVLVNGRVHIDKWTDSEGKERETVEVVPYTIGPSLAFNDVKVERTERKSGESSSSSSAPAGEDPWATNPPAAQGEDPPF